MLQSQFWPAGTVAQSLGSGSSKMHANCRSSRAEMSYSWPLIALPSGWLEVTIGSPVTGLDPSRASTLWRISGSVGKQPGSVA